MGEQLIVTDPSGTAPRAAVGPDRIRRAVVSRWPAATFPDPPPSVMLTVLVTGDEPTVIDVHPDGRALTVQTSHGAEAVARWWAGLVGCEVWITEISGVGYTAVQPPA